MVKRENSTLKGYNFPNGFEVNFVVEFG